MIVQERSFSLGWSVWWDTRLQAGEVWDEVIERELNVARCIVVLWSKASVSPNWVRAEANEGLQRNILVPALIEDVQPPLGFRLVQAESLFDWYGEPSHAGLNRLLAAISEPYYYQKVETIINLQTTSRAQSHLRYRALSNTRPMSAQKRTRPC
jgi:TIR domain